MRFCMGGVYSPDAGKFICFSIVAMIAIVAFVVVGTCTNCPAFPVYILSEPLFWILGGILLIFLSPIFYLVYCAVCHMWFPTREPGYPFESTQDDKTFRYSQYGNPHDRTQYSSPKATISDSKQKLVRSRLRKFDLSEEEAKLVFGTEWKDVLAKRHIGNSSGLFYDMLTIQSQILLDMSYRNKIFHIIDQVIRMIDSVFSEDLELVRSYEKFLDGRFGHGWYEYYKNQWEFFKAYKKTSFEINSENTLDEDYKIMKLDITATLDQIKEKFRMLALIKHPDKNNTNKTQSEQEFVKILQAYERIVTSKTSGGK